jgi:hypothetical protein
MGSAVIWTAIGASAATAYTLAFVLSLRMLARQLRAQSFSEVYERIQAEEVREARGLLYGLDEKKISFETWKIDESALRAVEGVCQRYDYFAKMVRYRFLPKRLILKNWAWQVERLWRVAKPFVQSRRSIPGQGRLWEDFQWLADQSSVWIRRHKSPAVLPVDR